jgi:hypothetical protein
MAKKRRVWVCRKCKDADCLTAFLRGSGAARVKKVGCQKVCKGPVAGLKVDGRMEWFARVDRAKPMVALARTLEHGKPKLPKALEARRVARRSGQKVR